MKEKLIHFLQKLPKTKKLCKIIYFGLPLYLRAEILPSRTGNYDYMHGAALGYLKARYNSIIEKYKNDKSLTVPTETLTPDCPYWVFWYQGEEQMPDIIKACVASIRRHAGQHPVHLLHKDNYTKYVRFSDTIMRKVEGKHITLTHFSELVRNQLLTQYGGVWLDATLYLTGEIPSETVTLPFITLRRHPSFRPSFVIGGFYWTDFFQGGVKGNPFHRFVRDMLVAYHENEPVLIAYGILNYCMYLGYTEVPTIQKMIDAVPFNNEQMLYFLDNLYKKPNEEELAQITQSTHIFKTTYKLDYSRLQGDGLLYHKILRGEI